MKLSAGLDYLLKIAVCVTWFIAGCLSLKDVRIVIPHAVEKGHRAILKCYYDLEGDQLYTVKWYRRGREFYRYTPRDSPPIKMFPIEGVQVMEDASNATQVVLAHVTAETTGDFTCEITADAPSFFTRVENALLEVVEIPKDDPVISGLKSRYKLDDTLTAKCTSNYSRPAANLTWFANGLPVDVVHLRRHSHRLHHSDHNSLLTAESALRLKITREIFKKGRLKIRCVASLHSLYYRSSEKSVELERQRPRFSSTPASPPALSPPHDTVVTEGYWERDSLPAERAPQTTLIFSMANDYPNSADNRKPILIATLIIIFPSLFTLL